MYHCAHHKMPGADSAMTQRADHERFLTQLALLQSSYISGIAQGANVGKDQVIILGVTSGTSVTVNTQVPRLFPTDIDTRQNAVSRVAVLPCYCR